MKKLLVVLVSIIADLVDFTGVGQILYPIDIVVIIIHMLYAGPLALISIIELIPFIGFLPIYTFLALLYKEK